MEKRSTFGVAWRLASPFLAALIVHLPARLLWIGNPIQEFENTNKPTEEICNVHWSGLPEYAYCKPVVPERTFWNYSTDVMGWVGSHIMALIALVIVIVIIAGIAAWIEWARFAHVRADEEGEEPYISECSDPGCRCKEHVIHDRFDYSRSRWVEREESSETAPAS